MSFNKDGSEGGHGFAKWAFVEPAPMPGKLWKEELDYAWFLTIKVSVLSDGSIKVSAGVSRHILHGLTVVCWVLHSALGEPPLHTNSEFRAYRRRR